MKKWDTSAIDGTLMFQLGWPAGRVPDEAFADYVREAQRSLDMLPGEPLPHIIALVENYDILT